MKPSDLTPDAVKGAIVEFYHKTSGLVRWMVKEVGNESMSIPAIPRKMGIHQFDYFFAAELDQVFRFALGGMQAAPKYINDLCATAERLLTQNALGLCTPLPADFATTPLGYGLALARARAVLRRTADDPIAADHVRHLTGESDAVLKDAGLLSPSGDPPDAVREFLAKFGLPQ